MIAESAINGDILSWRVLHHIENVAFRLGQHHIVIVDFIGNQTTVGQVPKSMGYFVTARLGKCPGYLEEVGKL